MKKLKSLISSKNAKICIIGLGYVGLPLAIKLAKKALRFMDLIMMREKSRI